MFFDVDSFLKEVKKKLHDSDDVGTRVFTRGQQKIGLIFLRSMMDVSLFSEAIYKPLKENKGTITAKDLIENTIKVDDVQEISNEEVIEKILKGCVIICNSLEETLLSVDIEKYPMRVPSEPPTSRVLQRT